MKQKFRKTLTLFCLCVLKVRTYRNFFIAGMMDWYLNNMAVFVVAAQNRMDTWIEAFRAHHETRQSLFKHAVKEATEWRRNVDAGNRTRLLNPIQRVGLTASAFRIATACELTFLRASNQSLRFSIGTMELALDVWRTDSRTHFASSAAFFSIFKSGTPIPEWELILWLATSPIFAEEALGDLREGYEQRLAKYGENAAISYVRKQVVRDVRNRISKVVGITTAIAKIIHWIHNHPRSN